MLGQGLELLSDEAVNGWCGPCGLASVIHRLVLTDDYRLDAIDEIGAVVLPTVTFSIVLHGLSAHSLATRYAASVTSGPNRRREIRAPPSTARRASDGVGPAPCRRTTSSTTPVSLTIACIGTSCGGGWLTGTTVIDREKVR